MSDVSDTSALLLPEGWSAPEIVADVIHADGLELHRVGLSSTRNGVEAIGSAADWQEPPRARAQFELLERVSILEAARSDAESFTMRTPDGEVTGVRPAAAVFPASNDPSAWAYARSNGVALHDDWTSACERAEQELAERDCILRAWLGETEPCRIELERRSEPFSRTHSFEWSAYEFPAPGPGCFAPGVHVAGVFGFPSEPSAPFVFGYGARDSLEGALTAATREAMQLLAFLWGEPVCDWPPEPAPTPMCHLETFQCPDRLALLRRWLEGAHRDYRRFVPAPDVPERDNHDACFVDLTPPWLDGRFRVAKALSGAAVPLAFGLAPLTAHLPPELRIHPIP